MKNILVKFFYLHVVVLPFSTSANVQVANLKQDLELISREVAGLRSEVELLRRENAQLRVVVQSFSKKMEDFLPSKRKCRKMLDPK